MLALVNNEPVVMNIMQMLSNYLAHQTILNEALAEQTQSILIFVAHPTKLEGEGNNALLSYLKNAEEKSSKTA